MLMGRIENLKDLLIGVLWGLFFCLLITILTECKTKYVSIPEYHTVCKTRTDSIFKKDSVWVHDSVSVWLKNDTVYKEKWHTEWRTLNTDKTRIDTIIKTDIITIPLPVKTELGKWQQTKIDYFMPLLCVCTIIVLSLLWLIKRRL